MYRKPSDPSNRLTVANLAQKVIFIAEMKGQLSDGQWENTNPQDHWEVWCDLDAKQVLIDPANIGINFNPIKRNYRFNDSELLECVGDRMLFTVKMAYMFPHLAEAIFSDHWTLPDTLEDYKSTVESAKKGEDKYWSEKLQKWTDLGITKEVVEAIDAYDGYTFEMLRKDCAGLSKAFKANMK